MPKYIDAEPYKDCKIVLHDEDKGAWVKDIPTADVQEVKHGEWKQVQTKPPKYACTNCRHLFNNRTFNYCPNCGARMDKE